MKRSLKKQILCNLSRCLIQKHRGQSSRYLPPCSFKCSASVSRAWPTNVDDLWWRRLVERLLQVIRALLFFGTPPPLLLEDLCFVIKLRLVIAGAEERLKAPCKIRCFNVGIAAGRLRIPFPFLARATIPKYYGKRNARKGTVADFPDARLCQSGCESEGERE